MKKYLLLLALVCLLGNRALAQTNRPTYTTTTEVKETIDFTGWNWANNGEPNANVNWENNSISSITGTNGSTLNRTYTNLNHSFFVGNGSGTSSTTIFSTETYFDDNWGTHITISNGQFTNANIGDIIRVNYKNIRDNFNPVLKQGGNNWYKDFFKPGSNQNPGLFDTWTLTYANGDNYFQWTINDSDALSYIKSNGLSLQGLGFTLTSVELIGQASEDYPENTWQLWKSNTHNETYLQKYSSSNDYFNITNLQAGDVVTIWGDNGQNGGCNITSGNANPQSISFNGNGQKITMQNDGTLQLQFTGQYSGIRKIEITKQEQQETVFDYDPGYEEYDMYDEFSWAKNNNPATTYSLTGSAGFQLNEADAKYITLSGSKITANNRIALTGNANAWTFDFGLVPPGNNGDYSYFSICNLREGDRVVISYINESEDPLIFASGKKDGEFYYNGCAAFKDENRDGVLNNGDVYINTETGEVTAVDWHRGEGNVGGNDQGQSTSYTPELCYTNSYVIAQDGHLDLAFKRFVENYAQGSNNGKKVSRIVKIKIFSDHQAMMVDKYDNGAYTAYYNITGELQAKEHIMPGGLEIHVGNNDATQHAIVVSSKDGPVSYINSAENYKIPGVSKSNNKLSINFDLGITGTIANLPSSGTYYRFIPEASGKMKFKFEAKSMNYYRWDLRGNDTYYNTDLKDNNGNYGNWGALNDRPNEQTVDAACPYYLVTVKNGRIQTVQKLNNNQDINNGGDWETPDYINVTEGEEYYLFGGWNQSNLYYNSSWTTPNISNNDRNNDASGSKQYNNIEFRPFDGRTVGCGVAELLWVEFKRNDEIYPLAKWVPNGTTAVNDVNKNNSERHGVPNPDTYVMEYELANIIGFTDYDNNITVKKMSGNITECHPYIVRDANDQTKGKLMIDGIKFAKDQNPGGTILIKIGDATKRTDPLYALTIAYSTDPKYDKKVNPQDEQSEVIRGHIWDFHTSSLQGLEWDLSNNASTPTPTIDSNNDGEYETFANIDSQNYAQNKLLGTYFANYYGAYGNEIQSSQFETVKGSDKNESSLLYEEIIEHGDWLFNYNLKYDEKMFDPVFTNKYDMEGDNADMIWDTEGTVFQTSANQSCIFNEYGSDINHDVTASTDIDPNRYVGILKGGKFRIPWLRKNDRVIIWMGSGTGRTDDFVSLKIKNAYDALYNEINPEDEYIVGGSQWYKDDSNYHGCYHFFAKGDEQSTAKDKAADMVFEMVGGEMCKIYKIQIYRGDRIITNEIVDKAATDNQFLLYSMKADPNEDISETNNNYTDNTTHEWALQYLGKDQQLANGTGKNTQKNEIIAKTGKYSSETPALTINLEVVEGETTSKVESFTYKHQLGEIGTFRVRGKDMEKNMNYVADYADHNVTIAYQETQPYPYTWDFMDMTGWGNNSDNFDDEDVIGDGQPADVSEEFWAAFGGSTTSKTYERTSRDLSLWEIDNDNNCYFLRLNSQAQDDEEDLMVQDNIFETAKAINGNQLWVNGEVVPETRGLWFYTDNNNRHNGKWEITNNGMLFNGKHARHQTLVVPNVPAGAAVYLRMGASGDLEDCEFEYQFEDGKNNCEVYGNGPQQVGSSKEYIFAIQNNGTSKRKLILSIAGYRLKKLGVSTDPKAIGKTGYATESRERRIDHSLTSYLTGETIKAYTASYGSITGSTDPDYSRVVLKEFDKPSLSGSAHDQENGGCILYHSGGTSTDRSVNILGGGFHLFIPDMHDGKDADGNDITTNDVDISNNILISFNPKKDSYTLANLATGYIRPDATDGQKTLVLSAKKYKYGTNGADVQEGYDVSFVRVDPKGNNNQGASLKYCSAYIKMPASQMKVLSDNNGGQAKSIIVFCDDLFGEINNGIATGISEVNEENGVNGKAEWYSLDGQKLNGVPTAKGLYIVNGKKVLVK